MRDPRVNLGANHEKCKKSKNFLILIFCVKSHQKNLLSPETEHMPYYLLHLLIGKYGNSQYIE